MSAGQHGGIAARMADSDKLTREQRLAARLRENLHRRKAQARAIAQDTQPPPLSKDHPDG